MQLSTRRLTRTLWVRQQLVPGHRLGLDAVATAGHLVGLQAQENLPPYLSLAARVPDLDPSAVSAAIEDRRLVRVLSLRGTVHLLPAQEALLVRPWMQPMLEKTRRANPQVRSVAHVETEALLEAAADALAEGPLPSARLGEALAAYLAGRGDPDLDPRALAGAARDRLPLVQVPPRGLWRQSGGVVYELLTTWAGAPLAEVGRAEVEALVRRYLRAFGPATPADVTAWSRTTGLGPLVREMPDLIRHTDEEGRVLYDVEDGELADEDLPLPVLLLGTYDNLWLSHADRARTTGEEARRAWTGPNGAAGSALFVDGLMAGLWRLRDGRVDVQPLPSLTRTLDDGARQALDAQLDAETTRVQTLLTP